MINNDWNLQPTFATGTLKCTAVSYPKDPNGTPIRDKDGNIPVTITFTVNPQENDHD